MIALIGIVVVIISVIGGFLLERGNPHVLFQPAELVIIGGSAAGAFLISYPRKVIIMVARDLVSFFRSEKTSKQHYLELLLLLYEIFVKVRKEGLLSLESDLSDPQKSQLFSKYVNIMANKRVSEFLFDSLSIIVSSEMQPSKLEDLLDTDIDTRCSEALTSSHSLTKTADSLPGLGIVAAVLGVVLTMGKINEPPAVLGHSIGAALVGTFLGILLCYGFVGPIGTNLAHRVKEEEIILDVIKISLVAFLDNAVPPLALETARRAIPGHERPSSRELEDAIKEWKKASK